ncbi:MAG: 6-pyruvoyl trahydropterin synthase family protein [Flavobacteriia bacterium]|jgi:6-pyruvoyltetrahydropterin/6-carboxytetrahydropterin synthase
MEKIRVSKKFSFELAHALHNYDGDCKNIHGHSYKLIITLIGPILNENENPKNGMVVDFKFIKNIVQDQIIKKYDHALILSHKSSVELIDMMKKINEKTIISDFQPSCENILIAIKNQLLEFLPRNLSLFSVRLYETSDSYAEWNASD